MKNNERTANVVMVSIGMLAMACLLIYNFMHTGSLLSRYVAPRFIGYICAAGIELSIVWLSFKLGRIRKLEASVFKTIPGITLILVILISMAANIAEGYYYKYSEELTSVTIGQIDWMQVVLAVLSTIMVSGVVFALSEVLSGDSKKLIPKQDHTDVNAAYNKNTAATPAKPVPVVNTRQNQTKQSADNKQEVFVKYVSNNPNASYRDIIRDTGVVKNTASIKPLAESVGWHKNGNGWERN